MYHDNEPDYDEMIEEDQQRCITDPIESEDNAHHHLSADYIAGDRAGKKRQWKFELGVDGGPPRQTYYDQQECTTGMIQPGPPVQPLTMWRKTQAEAYADKQRLSATFVIAQQTVNRHDREVFNFGAFQNETDVYREIASRDQSKRYLFEKIVEDQSSRVYFDLEWEYNKHEQYPSKQKPRSPEELLMGFVTWLPVFTKEYYGIEVAPSELLVSSACSPGIKISFHVLLPWRFENLEQRKQFKTLIERERNQIKAALPVQLSEGASTDIPFPERFGFYKGCPDETVYGKNQTFRMLLCNKRRKSNHLQPIDKIGGLSFHPWPPGQERQFYASLLTGHESMMLPKLPPTLEAHRSLAVSLDTTQTCNKRAADNSGGVEPPANHTAITAEIAIGLQDLNDSTSRPEKWLDPNTLSYRPQGDRRKCPMGYDHSTQPFHITMGRDAYYCICKFGSAEPCLNVKQWLCDRTPSWEVGREFYSHQRSDNRLRATVRPFNDTFSRSEDTHVIVDSSNMGTGKSYAADKFIGWLIEQEQQQHGQWVNSQLTILVIVHRVQLAREIHESYLSNRGFRLYLDEEEGIGSIRDAKRLVICVDSLWKIETEDWSCVIVDEIQEVLKSICRLKKKHPLSGKWNVWSKFTCVLQNCRRNILLSANADTLVKSTLDGLGFEPHQQKWQQNRQATLSHLTYEIHHFEPNNAKDIGYAKIFELLDQGKRLAIPCAEKGECKAIFQELSGRYPDKNGMKLEGSMTDTEKSEALTNAKVTVYDFIVYTASMDCGVSIDLSGYHSVVLCLSNRSIDAEVAMQMIQRVRSLADDKIFILCDTRVKDWNRWPGYRETKISESEMNEMVSRGHDIIEENGVNSVVKVKKYLMQHNARRLFYLWWSDRAKAWFRFRRILPQGQYSFDEAREMLLNPMKIEEALKDRSHDGSDTTTDDTNSPRINLGYVLDLADSDMIRTVVENKITKHSGLVDLMTRVLQGDLNRPRDILTDIIRIAKMQEATVTHTYNFEEPPEDALGTNKAMSEKKKEREKQEIDAIYSAERPTREQLIDDSATREQKRLEYAIRTFGEKKITQLQTGTTDDALGSDESESGDQNDSELSSSSSGGESSPPSIDKSKANIMDIKSQKVFREFCSLMDPETNPIQVIDDRMDRTKNEMEDPDQVDELSIEFGHYHHSDAVQKALFDLVETLGFKSPLDYETTVNIDDTKLVEISCALANLDRAQNGISRSYGRAVHSTSNGTVDSRSTTPAKDPIKSARAKLQNMWFISLTETTNGKRSHKRGATTDTAKKYHLTRHGKAKDWPEPSWSHHLNYQEFKRWKDPFLFKQEQKREENKRNDLQRKQQFFEGTPTA